MLLKDLYSPEFYASFADVLAATLADFERDEFISRIFVAEFPELELKQRMAHTADVLHVFLGADFGRAAAAICDLVQNLRAAGFTEQSVEYMFLPDYIQRYGIDDYATAVAAIETVTQYTSCEYAVRPFIQRYGDDMLAQMQAWSQHRSDQVRRLASEGARPRLPWAMALPDLKRDPAPILPILENLKRDPSETVRRSVANSLNDISKDNPGITLRLAERWLGDNTATDALVKHGCRGLLRQGDSAALKLFGFDQRHLGLAGFDLLTPRIAMGEALEFAFTVENRGRRAKPLRLDYAIYLLKKNGQQNKKVFNLSEREIAAGDSLQISKKHLFKPITTRRYYPGRHAVAVILNGVESEAKDFDLSV